MSLKSLCWKVGRRGARATQPKLHSCDISDSNFSISHQQKKISWIEDKAAQQDAIFTFYFLSLGGEIFRYLKLQHKGTTNIACVHHLYGLDLN